MAKANKTWYWKSRIEWYFKMNGIRYRLGPDKKAAEAKFHELMAKRESLKASSDMVIVERKTSSHPPSLPPLFNG